MYINIQIIKYLNYIKYIIFTHVKLIVTTSKSFSQSVKTYFYRIELEVCGMPRAALVDGSEWWIRDGLNKDSV